MQKSLGNWEFEIVAGPYGSTTEGPVWDGQAILFTHLSSHRILRYDPATGETADYITNNGRMNGLCFGASGALYACQSGERRMARVDKDRSVTALPHRLDGKRHNHPNDIAIDRKGRIWFSDPWIPQAADGPPQTEIDHASVLRLDPKGDDQWALVRATFDSVRPNGVLVSPDQKTLYVAECTNCPEPPPGAPAVLRHLRAYPINDDGSLGRYIVLHTFGVDHRGVHRGVDGMTFDSDGNIVAPCGSHRSGPGPMVYVFSPAGRVLETHPLPVDHPTNCCFGDADMRTFYMTTGEGYLCRARTDRTGWILWP